MNSAWPAVTPSPPPGQLQAVRDVVDDRVAERSQDREGAHVDDQVVVAEAVAALGDDRPCWLPAAVTFAIAWRMSSGARNCPFFTFTTRPVRAAATSRSVCRDRNAGICSTSATSATGAACAGSWMSVRIGTPAASRTRPSTRTPSSSPGPRNDAPDVRFALSYDALKTKGTPARRVMSRSASAGLDRVRLALDHARPGDEHQRAAADAHAADVDREHPLTLPRTPRPACRVRELVAVARLDEAGEQRVRLQRLRLELGVELHGDVPRVVGSSTISTNLPSSERPTISSPLLGQRLLVEAVELVAVAVPLVDDVAAVERVRPRARLQLARVRPSRIVPPRSSTPSRSRSL